MRQLTPARVRRTAAVGAPDRDGDTERRILDAAHAVFVRRGTAGARMQDIAAEARVNQALLHYYFRNKERLSTAVFLRAASQLFPRVVEVLASDAPLDEKVARVVRIEIEHLSRSPYLPGYIISELHHHPERVRELFALITGTTPEGVRPKVVATIGRQLKREIAAGRIKSISVEQFLVNLLSLCIFPFAARPMIMAILGLDQQGFERFVDRRRHELAGFFLGALRP
jgi:TetR/AcrR family transcriptional regulator